MRNKWEKVKAKVKLVLMVDDDDDQAPSEQDIEDALKILVSRKPELLEDSEGYNRTFRELRNELVPKIDEGITLTDQNMEHVEFTDQQVRAVTVWKVEADYFTAKVREKPQPHMH